MRLLRAGRRNAESYEVVLDQIGPLDLGEVVWKRWYEQVEPGGAVAWTALGDVEDVELGGRRGTVKVKVWARDDGDWYLRAAFFPPGLFSRTTPLLLVRGREVWRPLGRRPGVDGLLAHAWVTATDPLPTYGLRPDPDVTLETHEDVERRRREAEARAEVERAERKRRDRNARRREQRARKKALAISGAEYERLAVEEFGVTSDPLLAGYVLRDGRMLDLSGGQGKRVVDHREVPVPGIGGTEAMQVFMDKTGAVRWAAWNAERDATGRWHQPILMVDVGNRRPNRSQERVIEDAVDWLEPQSVELVRGDGGSSDRLQLEWPRSGDYVTTALSGWLDDRGRGNVEPPWRMSRRAWIDALNRTQLDYTGSQGSTGRGAREVALAERRRLRMDLPDTRPLPDDPSFTVPPVWEDVVEEAIRRGENVPVTVRRELEQVRRGRGNRPTSRARRPRANRGPVRFRPEVVRRRVEQHDASQWGPLTFTVPRPSSRIRVARHLLAHGYGALAEDLVDDGIVDVTGEADAVVLLVEALLAMPATEKLGEQIVRSMGALDRGRRNVDLDRVLVGLQAEPRYSVEVSLARGPWRTLSRSATDAEALEVLRRYADRVALYDSVEALPLHWTRRRVTVPWDRRSQTRSIAYLHAGHRTFRVSRVPEG